MTTTYLSNKYDFLIVGGQCQQLCEGQFHPDDSPLQYGHFNWTSDPGAINALTAQQI